MEGDGRARVTITDSAAGVEYDLEDYKVGHMVEYSETPKVSNSWMPAQITKALDAGSATVHVGMGKFAGADSAFSAEDFPSLYTDGENGGEFNGFLYQLKGAGVKPMQWFPTEQMRPLDLFPKGSQSLLRGNGSKHKGGTWQPFNVGERVFCKSSDGGTWIETTILAVVLDEDGSGSVMYDVKRTESSDVSLLRVSSSSLMPVREGPERAGLSTRGQSLSPGKWADNSETAVICAKLLADVADVERQQDVNDEQQNTLAWCKEQGYDYS
ncbi:unnamed protein product [Effrenium voratum]|nr:unnamed protein product [Effrenium voratum]